MGGSELDSVKDHQQRERKQKNKRNSWMITGVPKIKRISGALEQHCKPDNNESLCEELGQCVPGECVLYIPNDKIFVCLFVCIYACMYVCMYACIHLCMYVCMHVSHQLRRLRVGLHTQTSDEVVGLEIV